MVGTSEASDGSPSVVPRRAPRPLLQRVRHLFVLLAALLVLAEVIELVDARTPLWPQRVVAVAGVAVAAVLVELARRNRAVGSSLGPLPLGGWDLAAAATLTLTGWGLGRIGAVLALLLGVGILRSLFGSRRSVVAAELVFLAAYASIGVVLDGPRALLDLNFLVVGLGLGAFASVTRLVAEVIAEHDVAASWDRVLAVAAGRLLTAADLDGVDATLEDAVALLDEGARVAAGGLVAVPTVADVHPVQSTPRPEDAFAVRLYDRLHRLHTEARLARSLLASEDRYRRLAEGSRDGIYLRSAATVTSFPYVNAAGRDLLGDLDRPGAPGIDLGRLHDDDRVRLVERFKASGYIAAPIRVRIMDPTAPDDWRWIELVETPASTTDGRITTVQGTVRDVTAQHEQEAALAHALVREQQATEQLRAVDEMRATFLAAISHELRTPLAGLVGASQTLAASDGRLGPGQAQALAGVVERQSARVVGLLDDLLDVERLSRGRMGVNPSPVALLQLARSVAAGSPGSGVVEVEGDDVVVTVDRTHVERILHNLLRNAMKHAASATRGRIVVEEHPLGAQLAVEDDGPGVPSAIRDQLFEPFVHGPGAGSLPSPGAGIGLALVSKFAELHGGRAWVEEASSGGARFVVLLGDGAAVGTGPAGTATETDGAGLPLRR